MTSQMEHLFYKGNKSLAKCKLRKDFVALRNYSGKGGQGVNKHHRHISLKLEVDF